MYEVKMPKLGQTVEEAEIVQWLKQEGDLVNEGDALFTVQTDKAEIEYESPASGVLRKILIGEGVEVPVLTTVALIGAADEALPDLAQYGVAPVAASVTEETPAAQAAPSPLPVASPAATGAARVSPRARKIAAERGIDATALRGSGVGGRVMAADVSAQAARAEDVRITPTARRMAANVGIDITAVQGTGIGGKITKDDISRAAAQPAPTAPAAPGGVTRVPLTPMRRIIAQRMSESKYSAPHYYLSLIHI